MNKRRAVVAEPNFELLIAAQSASRRLVVASSLAIVTLAPTIPLAAWLLFELSAMPIVISALLGCIAILVAGSEVVDRAERCRGLKAMREAWHATAPGPAGDATRRCLASLMRSIYGPQACEPEIVLMAYDGAAPAPELQRAA